jgi:hypothetical protein
MINMLMMNRHLYSSKEGLHNTSWARQVPDNIEKILS